MVGEWGWGKVLPNPTSGSRIFWWCGEEGDAHSIPENIFIGRDWRSTKEASCMDHQDKRHQLLFSNIVLPVPPPTW